MDLRQLNEELRSLNIGVYVEAQGQKIYLRALLPPKPNSKKRSPHRQRIALGINANEDGLRRAKAEAIKLGGLMACKEFEWGLYVKNDKLTCAEWGDRHREDYFARRADRPQTRTTYRSNYQQIFNKLPPGRRLTAQVIKETLLGIPPDTKQRRRGTMALTKLAEFAGLEVDLQRYKGCYSHKSVKRRTLPGDAELIEIANAVPNVYWRNFALILITYGLRPHEGFYCDFTEAPVLYVTDGKTGDRHVAPLYPEWVDEFDLAHAALPPGGGAVGKRDFTALGDRVTTQFRRYGVPISTYIPRHCYARRSKRFGIAAIDAAKMMGHSLQEHFRSYHHHYEKDEVMMITDQIAANPNRPRPPMPK